MSADPLNAFVTRLDEPLVRTPDGPLRGLRLAVKDLIDTAGLRTTYGSDLYREHVPAVDATVVERALAAGATLVGKTHLPEFAWGVLGQSPWLGTCRNPVQPGRTTGGSSSGNGAALAAGLCDLAIGTDTGGSIRLPAACCEVVGLKPAHGSVPIDGVFPLAPSFDTVGPMARTVADVTLLWSVLTGRPAPAPRLRGLRVGLLRAAPETGDGRHTERSDAAEGWVERLEHDGAAVVEASIPPPPANTWPVFAREALRAHAATFPLRADAYGAPIRAKLEDALRSDDDDRVDAGYAALTTWRRFQPEVDLYVCPTIGIDLPDAEADEPTVRLPFSSFVRWVNLLGWAALAIGPVQLIAPRDETVLAAGLAWERG